MTCSHLSWGFMDEETHAGIRLHTRNAPAPSCIALGNTLIKIWVSVRDNNFPTRTWTPSEKKNSTRTKESETKIQDDFMTKRSNKKWHIKELWLYLLSCRNHGQELEYSKCFSLSCLQSSSEEPQCFCKKKKKEKNILAEWLVHFQLCSTSTVLFFSAIKTDQEKSKCPARRKQAWRKALSGSSLQKDRDGAGTKKAPYVEIQEEVK